MTADEHSEEEEPATTSADDEATKKPTTEQQKQLSKKVSLLFFLATPCLRCNLDSLSIQPVYLTQPGQQQNIIPGAAVILVKPYCSCCMVYVATSDTLAAA